VEKYGIVKNGEVLETFKDKESAFQRFMEIKGTDSLLGFRKLFFSELTEEEKLQTMQERYEELKAFLEQAEGSGRTTQSHTKIYLDELKWLLDNTNKYINMGKD